MKRRYGFIATMFALTVMLLMIFSFAGSCSNQSPSDIQQASQQEQIAQQSNQVVGMPNITNFREKATLKQIYELRDQANLVTYSYIFSIMTGKFTFIGQTIGYPIPYATQFTNPDKIVYATNGNIIVPQQDPNALFSPSSAAATWVLLKEPAPSVKVSPFYCEENIETFQSKLPDSLVSNPELQAQY
jgi:uncharacterized membrane protein YeiB